MGTGFSDEIKVGVADAGGRRTVLVEGEIRLAGAGSLRQVLVEELCAGQQTVLDLAGVTGVDLSGLQLLCSAHRTYVRHDAVLELQGVTEELTRTARRAGFDARTSVCPFRRGMCLWRD